jgi:hypothetical protein
MTVLTTLLVVLLLFVVSVYAISVASIEDKNFRRIFFTLGLLMPGVVVWAFLVTLFKSNPPIRFREEVGRVEDEIEAKRIEIFGGAPVCPSFSVRWHDSYTKTLERTAQRAVKASKRIAEFGSSVNIGRA